MPTYSYEHTEMHGSDCAVDFDIQQSIKDEPFTKCPVCKYPVKRVITQAPGFRFNGTGFTPKFH